MHITILGNNGPFAGPGKACSGYLIEEGDTCLLIDLGNGVLERYLSLRKLEDINAIILSHLHNDHIGDMFILRYALELSGITNVPVYIPESPDGIIQSQNVKGVFDLRPINALTRFGNIEFKTMRTIHPVETYAISFKCSGKKCTYTSDTSYFEELKEFAMGSDILICESGLLRNQKKEDSVHLTAYEAGCIARDARVKSLYLTHFYPFQDPKRYLEEAREVFKDSFIAGDFLRLEV
ncbi:Ribonuclease BN, tRNA processing enzyme [Caldanaerobius fijiensis DSM 17918]|uniref:Ribonuclease BN, tRNA processing enzyme n=1 Tax=Caldanaerobius fijiensis DSM 17918 TaxID=1121256 RepID=A0A1M4SHF6_9THEO|nr:MBL fold metallo-hydrolase [Caldanaerobius fijiensis]SHE31588.1 Ribonuclease BN, tRNA processing enzyme [Caldanaerobius fijiensis DSM 17918]